MTSAPASGPGDFILQLLIDTGAGNMFPVSDDYYVTREMAWCCAVFLLPMGLLKDATANESASRIRSALELSRVYPAPKTIAFLTSLLADCEDSPGAVISVIEVE